MNGIITEKVDLIISFIYVISEQNWPPDFGYVN